MAQVDEKFDRKRDLYASLFGAESDDDCTEHIVEEVFGTNDDDIKDIKVDEETKIPSKIYKQQQAYDFSESRLEAAAKKLRDKYQSLEKAKRQKKIQVLEDTPLFSRLQKPKKIISRRHPILESRLRKFRI